MNSSAMLCGPPLQPPTPPLDWKYADGATAEMDSHTCAHAHCFFDQAGMV